MLKNVFVFLCYTTITIFTFLFLSFVFNEEPLIADINAAAGQLVDYSECKTPGDTSCSYGHTSSEDCINYSYDGSGNLYLTHINSGFSLCPGELTAKISITDHSIIIEEKESESGCYEMCLYNLEYVMNNLRAGEYIIKVFSPYPDSQKPLEFTVDLSAQCRGCFTVSRNEYPWST